MQSSTMTDNNALSVASSLVVVPHGTNRVAEVRRRAATLLARSPQETELVLRGAHPDLIELSAPEGKEKIALPDAVKVLSPRRPDEVADFIDERFL